MSRILTVGIRRLGRALFILATLLGAAAQADAATLNLTWTAPTTNANGTPLTDLAGYRVYIDTSSPACPGGPSHAVASTTDSPGSGQTVSSRITSLTASATYFIRITAVDDSGNESGCSPQVSGVAGSDIAVTPHDHRELRHPRRPASTADRTFTVQNTSTAAVSGTASVGRAVLRSSPAGRSLSGPALPRPSWRASSPPPPGTFAGNVNFTVDGDTLSRALSGVGDRVEHAPLLPSARRRRRRPDRSRSSSPTRSGGTTVPGSDTAVVWVDGTSGSSNTFTLSVDGRVTGTETTSARGPVTLPWTSLPNGAHTVTASVRDAAGNTGSMSITVNVAGSSATGPPPPPPPPPPPTDTLSVAVTQPTEGTTVGGIVWVVMWVDGASGSSNTFTLSVDGATVASETTSARGPVSDPVDDVRLRTEAHTLTAMVRDAAGNTGRSSVS